MKLSLEFLTGFQKLLSGSLLILIVIYFFMSRSQEDKWERLKKGLAESYGESPVSPTDSPVYPIDVEGEARYKRPSWLNWWPLKVGVELQPGDLVYVEDASKVVLFFIGQDSIVTLPEGSLFHVGLTVPQMSKLRTSGGVSAELGGDSNNKKESTVSQANFSTRVIQNPAIKKAGSKSGNSDNSPVGAFSDDELKVVRNTKPLVVRYPAPNIEIVAENFPTSIPVTFDVAEKTTRLWGYLWKGKELEPQWSSVASAGFPRVPIEEPGEYVFQAQSEDELFASQAIMIRAVKRGEGDFLPKPENWLEGMRIFQ